MSRFIGKKLDCSGKRTRAAEMEPLPGFLFLNLINGWSNEKQKGFLAKREILRDSR